MKGEKIYGVADKAWQVVVGCDPHMPCAPRCWARRTVERIVRCQGDGGRELFQIALTPDGKRWSGEVRLDEVHLEDPLEWRKPALIATGFHGDWGRLSHADQLVILRVMDLARHHTFIALTKQPQSLVLLYEDCVIQPHVSIGCSVMNQSEADAMREPMARIAALGWSTHVWYEPALGPVNWKGWEFLRGVIAGGESGADSRPSQLRWYQETRDWCVARGVPFNFKQWGDWLPPMCDGAEIDGRITLNCSNGPERVGKARAGRLLDGRTWDELPAFSGASL